MATLLLVLLPNIPHLPIGLTLFCVMVGGWWLHILRLTGKPWHVNQWLRAGFVGIIGVILILSYGQLSARQGWIALLVGLSFLKLLELKSRRDFLLIYVLGCFLLMTLFYRNQSLIIGLYTVLVAFFLLAGLLLLNNPDRPVKPVLKQSGVLLMQSVPLMLVLFFLFPRLASPLWSLPHKRMGVTGLSDQMRPGSVSRLIASAEVAFRVTFANKRPMDRELYWRGPVLWFLEGDTWRLPKTPLPIRAKDQQWLGEGYLHTVTLQPHHQRWLFVLDLPDSPPPDSQLLNDYQLLSKSPVTVIRQYQAVSHTRYRVGMSLGKSESFMGLQLPKEGNPKTRRLAQEWASVAHSAKDVVEKALAFFRDQPFVYTLNPPLLGMDPMDDFLFDSRRGFCEHYAGSFTFLMRAAGIPSRVVTGYHGGSWNPFGNHLTVRQSDAHAWSEVWLSDQGWVRVDPTAQAVPERLEEGWLSTLPVGDHVPLSLDLDNPLFHKVWQGWDAMDNGWNQWVLGYNHRRQLEFLDFLQGGKGVVGWMIGGGVLMVIGGLLSLLIRLRNRVAQDPVVRLYQMFCATLATLGIVKLDTEGPLDFSKRAISLYPEAAPAIKSITQIYISLRYRTTPPENGLIVLSRQVKLFRKRGRRRFRLLSSGTHFLAV